MPEIHDIYLGYHHDILLGASIDYKLLRDYLEKIRGLKKSQYSIYESTLDDDTILALYEDYLLEEYVDDIFIPSKDAIALDNSVKHEFQQMSDTMQGVARIYEITASDDKLHRRAKGLDGFLIMMDNLLTSQDSVNRMRNVIIGTSPVLSSNIGEYISHTRCLIESNELREMFLTKISDENE